jgi:hypothetical protein
MKQPATPAATDVEVVAVSDPSSKLPGGVTGKGFVPGISGNPGGRMHSLTSLARKRTKDGRLLIEAWRLIALGTDAEIRQHFGTKKSPSIQDRLDAIGALAERGWGRPRQAVDLTADPLAGGVSEGARDGLERLLLTLADRTDREGTS